MGYAGKCRYYVQNGYKAVEIEKQEGVIGVDARLKMRWYGGVVHE